MDLLNNVELQLRGLGMSPTVEAREVLVQDEPGAIRTRLELQEYAPSRTVSDSTGKERLKLGLWTEGAPCSEWRSGRCRWGEPWGRMSRGTPS